jgi:hypothetical protein
MSHPGKSLVGHRSDAPSNATATSRSQGSTLTAYRCDTLPGPCWRGPDGGRLDPIYEVGRRIADEAGIGVHRIAPDQKLTRLLSAGLR